MSAHHFIIICFIKMSHSLYNLHKLIQILDLLNTMEWLFRSHSGFNLIMHVKKQELSNMANNVAFLIHLNNNSRDKSHRKKIIKVK